MNCWFTFRAPLTTRNRFVSGLSLLLMGIVFPLTSCQADDLSPVAGTWKIRINGGGEIYQAKLTVEQLNGDWIGRYENDGRRSRVSELRMNGKTLTVVVNTQRFSTPVVATFSCDIAGESMSGEVDFDSGSSARSYDFKGERISRPASAESSADATVSAAENSTQVTSDTDMPSSVDDSTLATAKVRPAEAKAPKSVQRVSFQNGLNGYNKAIDAEIWAIAPSKSLLRQGTMTTDGNNGGGESQVLLRFSDVFGSEAKQIPQGARIVSAQLTVVAFDPGTTCYIHRLLVPWTSAVTWDGMANGVSIDNIEASTVRDGFTFGEINMDKQLVQFDVTSTVQRWCDGAPNYGWVFINTGGNGWDFYSSDWIEGDIRPRLDVRYVLR